MTEVENKPKIVCVVGPTASGKTEYAIEIAEKCGGEIVSCDSMQIYKYMDIGTAKPTPEERARIPHYMIDFVDPNTDYSVADFVAAARMCIDDIICRGRLPVLCGGTGLYIDSIINGVEFADNRRDDKYRSELWKMAKEQGSEAVHDLLKVADPKEAEKIHPNNLKRVIRALEICKTCGMTKTEADKAALKESKYSPKIYGLRMDRERLYGRINTRVDMMMKKGLLDEVKRLIAMGVQMDSTAMQAIGYKELVAYIRGDCSLEEAVDAIKQESRRYAKRQMTWFKRNRNINWIEL